MHTNSPLYVLSKTKIKISKICLFFADVSKKSAKNAKFCEKYGPTSNGHNFLLVEQKSSFTTYFFAKDRTIS